MVSIRLYLQSDYMCGNLLLFALNILAVIRFAIGGNIDAHVRT